MAMVFISIFNVLGCIAISVYFGWKFALIVIAASMPIILGSGYYRVRHEVKFESRNNEVFAESAKFATEAIRAIRTVASLTLEDTICARYGALLNDHINKSFKEARFSMILFAASDSLVLLCMAFALWYGGSLLAKFEYHPFNFFVIYYAILQVRKQPGIQVLTDSPQGSMAAGQWLSFGPSRLLSCFPMPCRLTCRRYCASDCGSCENPQDETRQRSSPPQVLHTPHTTEHSDIQSLYDTIDHDTKRCRHLFSRRLVHIPYAPESSFEGIDSFYSTRNLCCLCRAFWLWKNNNYIPSRALLRPSAWQCLFQLGRH